MAAPPGSMHRRRPASRHRSRTRCRPAPRRTRRTEEVGVQGEADEYRDHVGDRIGPAAQGTEVDQGRGGGTAADEEHRGGRRTREQPSVAGLVQPRRIVGPTQQQRTEQHGEQDRTGQVDRPPLRCPSRGPRPDRKRDGHPDGGTDPDSSGVGVLDDQAGQRQAIALPSELRADQGRSGGAPGTGLVGVDDADGAAGGGRGAALQGRPRSAAAGPKWTGERHRRPAGRGSAEAPAGGAVLVAEPAETHRGCDGRTPAGCGTARTPRSGWRSAPGQHRAAAAPPGCAPATRQARRGPARRFRPGRGADRRAPPARSSAGVAAAGTAGCQASTPLPRLAMRCRDCRWSRWVVRLAERGMRTMPSNSATAGTSAGRRPPPGGGTRPCRTVPRPRPAVP